MGNIVGKRDDLVDGGFTFPTGTVYQKIDCDLRIVGKFITELRVSPFYKGLSDAPDSSFVECPICFLASLPVFVAPSFDFFFFFTFRSSLL